MARMTEAAGRIFGDPEQAMPLIEQLIYEQATQECKAAITPRKSKGLQDWVKVCREIGGPLTNAGLAAAILQSQKGSRTGEGRRHALTVAELGILKRTAGPLVRRGCLGFALSVEKAITGPMSVTR